MESKRVEILDRITGLDEDMMEKAQSRLDSLTKPPGSLGKLEEIAKRLAGITKSLDISLDKRELLLFAADHGVVQEGVSAFPQAVTKLMVLNFLQGGAAINVFSKLCNTKIRLFDIGMVEDVEHEELHKVKIRRGTANFCEGPAMTVKEAEQAMEVGMYAVEQAKARGIQLLATGEMGIGNTTASSALLTVLGGVPLEDAVGRGTGVDDAGLMRKRRAIERAIAYNDPRPEDPVDVLAKLGGLEIAGLTGMILGAAAYRIPVVIDGFISSAAALVASRIAPKTTGFMFASHSSLEQGHQCMLKQIGLSPLMHLDMRLGEGTGAVLSMQLLDAAVSMMRDMATFAEAGIGEGS